MIDVAAGTDRTTRGRYCQLRAPRTQAAGKLDCRLHSRLVAAAAVVGDGAEWCTAGASGRKGSFVTGSFGSPSTSTHWHLIYDGHDLTK